MKKLLILLCLSVSTALAGFKTDNLIVTSSVTVQAGIDDLSRILMYSLGDNHFIKTFSNTSTNILTINTGLLGEVYFPELIVGTTVQALEANIPVVNIGQTTFDEHGDANLRITNIGGSILLDTDQVSVGLLAGADESDADLIILGNYGSPTEFYTTNSSTVFHDYVEFDGGTNLASGGGGYAVEPATVTFILNQGVSASTGVFTSTITAPFISISSLTTGGTTINVSSAGSNILVDTATANYYAGVRRTLFDVYTTSGDVANTETNLFIASVTANTLQINGDMLDVSYEIFPVGSSATRNIKIYVGTTTIVTTALIPTQYTAVTIKIMRDSQTTARCSYLIPASPGTVTSGYMPVGGLNWTSSGTPIKIAVTTSGAGTANNDVSGLFGKTEYVPYAH